MKKFVKFPIYFLSFFLLVAVSSYVTFRVLSSGMEVEVPDLTGASLTEAENMLSSRGLYLKIISEDYDLVIPKGHVLSQDMPAGSHVKGQTEIKVAMSKGPELHLIPEVVGETLEAAEGFFREKGLEVSRVIHVHSETIGRGRIIAQLPAPDEWTGEPISVIVSEGPYAVTYYCPSFQGMLKDDALMLARQLGLNVELTESDDVIRIVTEQKPEPGTEIKAGSTVYLEFKGDYYR
jgi:beta-lactam-binding protein with PASTA domain